MQSAKNMFKGTYQIILDEFFTYTNHSIRFLAISFRELTARVAMNFCLQMDYIRYACIDDLHFKLFQAFCTARANKDKTFFFHIARIVDIACIYEYGTF